MCVCVCARATRTRYFRARLTRVLFLLHHNTRVVLVLHPVSSAVGSYVVGVHNAPTSRACLPVIAKDFDDGSSRHLERSRQIHELGRFRFHDFILLFESPFSIYTRCLGHFLWLILIFVIKFCLQINASYVKIREEKKISA